jgi:hypothetical protein
MSLGRGAGQDLKELNTDVYDGTCCAACLEPITPDVFMCGLVSTGRPIWEAEEGVDQILQGLSSGPATDAAVLISPSASASQSMQSPVPVVSSMPQVGLSAAFGSPLAVPTVKQEAPVASMFLGAASLTATDNQVLPVPSSGQSVVDMSNGVPVTPAAGESQSSQMTDSLALLPSLTMPLSVPLTVSFATPAVTSSVPAQADTSAALTSEVAVPAAVDPALASYTYTCSGCKLVVHKGCVVGHRPDDGADWQCDVCLLRQLSPNDEPPHITCALCPRRGGYFKRTTDFKWAHVYCAQATPGQVRVLADGKIEIRAVPKENRKEKCVVCNRKNGACVQCNFVGCSTQFHPICGARSGKGCIRTRQGERIAYCYAHLPEGLERMPSGHWVDGYEIERLRYGLERARLILDVLVRREKHKKMLCKAETELFSIRFHKMLDKAKKRKPKSGEDEVDLSDMSLYDSESDYYTDDDGADKLADALSPGQFIPLSEVPGGVSREEDMVLPVSTGESLNISGAWIKRKEVRLPKRLIMTYCGVEIDRKDVSREPTQRGFLKHYQGQVLKSSNAMRAATQIFNNAHDEAEFGRSVAPKLKKHMNMPDEDFIAAMRTAPWLKLAYPGASEGVPAVKKTGKPGRPKKGYAVVYEEDEEVEDPEADSELGDDDYGASGRRGSGVGRGRKPGRPRAISEAESQVSAPSAEGKKGRGRPRKQQPIDAWLTSTEAVPTAGKAGKKSAAPAEVFSPESAPGRRGGASKAAMLDDSMLEDGVDETPARKKSKKQLSEDEAAYYKAMNPKRGRTAASSSAAALADEVAEVPPSHSKAPGSSKKGAAAAAAAAVEAAPADKPIKKEFKAKREVELASPEQESSGRAKRQRLRESETAEETASSASALADEKAQLEGIKTKEDAKVHTVGTLFALERRLKDILTEIEVVEVPDFTDEELYGPNAPKKSAKKGKLEERGMRRLAEDFEEVPYDAIPNYDKLVPRVVTLNMMHELLNAHKYRSMADFVDDFYQLLNNARSITPPGSVVSVYIFSSMPVIYSRQDCSDLIDCFISTIMTD